MLPKKIVVMCLNPFSADSGVLSKNIFTDCPQLRESIGVLTARHTEIVNCNWEGSASKAPPRVGLMYRQLQRGAERATKGN